MKKFSRITSIPFLFILFALVIIPTLLIIYESFIYNSTFSIRSLIEIFKSPSYLKNFIKSIIYAMWVTIGSIAIGYPISLIIWRTSKKVQYLVLSLIILQMWINLVAKIRALKYMLNLVKLDATYIGSIIAGIYVFIPFLIIALVTQLNKIDDNLLDACKDLGAKLIQSFLKIIFPLSLPGLISGITLVFFPATTTVVITQMINNQWTIGNLIESLTFGSNKPLAYGIALLIVMLLLMFLWLVDKTNAKYEIEESAHE